MNVLILVNSAPKYLAFFLKLSELFTKSGDKVLFACQNKYIEYKEDVHISNYKKFYFSDYVNNIENFNRDISDVSNLRKYYFSCFDRHDWYKVCHHYDKQMDNIIINLLNYFDNIIEREQIDIVLYENVSNSFAYAAKHICNKYNKKYFGLITSRIPDRFEIWTDEYGNIIQRRKMFENEDVVKSIDYGDIIKNYLDNIGTKKPDYMKNNSTNYKVNYTKLYFKKLPIIKNQIRYLCTVKDDFDYQGGNPFTLSYAMMKRNFSRKLKTKYVKRFFDSIDYNDKYYIFPLHFQPESSTSINSMYTMNQYETIKNIVFSLPLNTCLYVKEHPNGVGFQSIEFYKKLKQLPNVKYVNYNEDNVKLINNSRGIITLTSTMGYEALLMNKPVITLGKVFYNYHPYCFFVETYEKLYGIIKHVENMKFENFEEINKRFLKVYFSTTYGGKVFSDLSDENIDKVFCAIKNRYYEEE